MKKIALFLLILVVVSTLFGACGKKNGDASSTPTDADANSVVLGELEEKYIGYDSPVELAVDGSANYSIVRGKECDASETSAAAYIMKQLKTTFGTSYQSVQDDKEDAGNEILIGNTNRKESGYAKELLEAKSGRSTDYIICVIDNKICIYGMSYAATKSAAEYFVANYATQSSLDQKLCYYNVADDANFKQVTLGDTTKLFKYNVVRARYNVSYMEQLAMENLVTTIHEATGYQVDIVKDELTEAQDYEIILGETTREGEETITEYDSYSINPVGNKIYINGGNTYSRAIAVDKVTEMIKNGTPITQKITGSYKESIAGYDDSALKLAYTEEFDGTAINNNVWAVSDIGQRGTGASDGSGMKSYRAKKNTYLKDGKLWEVATYDNVAYYGSYVQSHGNLAWQYGYIEASMVIPYGPALWSCMWCTTDKYNMENYNVGNDYYNTEINVMECTGANSYAANMHFWPTTNGKANGKTHDSLDNGYSKQKRAFLSDEEEYFYTDFHTVGYHNLGDRAVWTLDGEVYFEFDFTAKGIERAMDACNDPMGIKFTFAVAFKGTPVKGAGYWDESNKFIIDYCHIYQDAKGKIYEQPGMFPEDTYKAYDKIHYPTNTETDSTETTT